MECLENVRMRKRLLFDALPMLRSLNVVRRRLG